MSKIVEIPKYSLVVEWSEEDNVWVGRAPELFYGGVHGSDRHAVFAELCDVVDGVIEDAKKTGVAFVRPRDLAPASK